MSTIEEIATVYHSDINRASKTVWNRPDGHLHFLNGLDGCGIHTLLPQDWMDELSKICATDNKEVGCEPKKLGRD